MLNLSYNVSQNLTENLGKIDDLRQSILCVPLSFKNEANFRFNAIIKRIYYSLLLSDIKIKKEEIAKLLIYRTDAIYGPEDDVKNLAKNDRQIAGYKKALDYISQDWLVNNEVVTPKALINLYRLLTFDSRLIAEKLISDLTSYIQIKPEHPVIEAGVAMIGTLKTNPFPQANDRMSRLISYLFLYKKGYDFRNLVTQEEYWYQDFGGFKENVKQFIENDNITLWLEYFTHSLVLHLENIFKEIQITDQIFKIEEISISWELNERQKKILSYLDIPGEIMTNRKLQKLCNISQITAARELTKLTSRGLLNIHGKGRSVYYTKI